MAVRVCHRGARGCGGLHGSMGQSVAVMAARRRRLADTFESRDPALSAGGVGSRFRRQQTRRWHGPVPAPWPPTINDASSYTGSGLWQHGWHAYFNAASSADRSPDPAAARRGHAVQALDLRSPPAAALTGAAPEGDECPLSWSPDAAIRDHGRRRARRRHTVCASTSSGLSPA